MSKLKLSFSLVLMLFLVGMFGAMASAATPAPGTAPTWNGDLPKNGVETGKDNGIVNANQSGVGTEGTTKNADGVIKSDGMTNQDGSTGSQKTHGEYHNNTNSCASCHQTHTAESKQLLFKDGVYSTCTACHDGTLGFYNVFENSNHKNSAGTFGGSTETGNMSAHMVNGAVTVTAAPGGNVNDERGGTWSGEFNCASCHSPHGSYSDRLLHYNPNDMGNVKPEDGGIKADDVPVFAYTSDSKYPAATTKYIAVKGLKADHKLTDSSYDSILDTDLVVMIYEKSVSSSGVVTYKKTTNPWLYGYPVRGSDPNRHYYYTRLFTEDPVGIVTVTDSTTGKINGTYNKSNDTKVIDHYDYNTIDRTAGTGVNFKYGKGLVYGPVTGVLKDAAFVEISRAYVVKLDLVQAMEADGTTPKMFGTVPITTVNQRALFAGDLYKNTDNTLAKFAPFKGTTSDVTGLGVAMSTFCSSCHVDYLAKSGAASGTFNTTSFRHTTTSDSYTCVRCHFAHGTDVEIMRDSHNRTIDDLQSETVMGPGKALTETQAHDYLLDKNPSSALKRYTNMSVCWGCHTSSHAEQLKNTSSYDSTSGDPMGLNVNEGKTNWPNPAANGTDTSTNGAN
jgi:predicted CXXCH cytochrome family protein